MGEDFEFSFRSVELEISEGLPAGDDLCAGENTREELQEEK